MLRSTAPMAVGNHALTQEDIMSSGDEVKITLQIQGVAK